MTDPLYNSASVMSQVCDQFDDPRTERIVGLVDEFATGDNGATRAVIYGGAPHRVRAWQDKAAIYVKRQYGERYTDPVTAVAWPVLWFFLKPLVLKIITAFLNRMQDNK